MLSFFGQVVHHYVGYRLPGLTSVEWLTRESPTFSGNLFIYLCIYFSIFLEDLMKDLEGKEMMINDQGIKPNDYTFDP